MMAGYLLRQPQSRGDPGPLLRDAPLVGFQRYSSHCVVPSAWNMIDVRPVGLASSISACVRRPAVRWKHMGLTTCHSFWYWSHSCVHG